MNKIKLSSGREVLYGYEVSQFQLQKIEELAKIYEAKNPDTEGPTPYYISITGLLVREQEILNHPNGLKLPQEAIIFLNAILEGVRTPTFYITAPMGDGHSSRSHSLISPSGAKRWMACSASPTFEDKYGVEGDQSFADEGTLAHEIAECHLRLFIYGYDAEHQDKLEELRKSEIYFDGMEDDVMVFVDNCLGVYDEDGEVFLEMEIPLPILGEGFKGHNDFAFYNPYTNTLHVDDLKFGAGVKVTADKNEQLMLYALGLRDILLDMGHAPEYYILTIVQPRIGDGGTISVYHLEEEELLAFADKVRESLILCNSDTPSFRAGSHCQFCKAKARCPELAKETKEVFQVAIEYFNGERVIMPEDYEYYMAMQSNIAKFFKAIKAEAMRLIESGKKVEGFKLVSGRSVRYFTDPEMVGLTLDAMGYEPDKIYDTKLRSLTAIEKLVTRKRFSTEFADMIGRTVGKLTLALEDDNRLAVSGGAELDFMSIEIEDEDENFD